MRQVEVGPRSRLFRELVKPVYRDAQVRTSRGLDAILGVQTTAPPITDEGVPLEHQWNRPWSWVGIARMFRRHPLRPDDAFIDVGSGAGRVATIAALTFACRGVTAIERDTETHRLAERNVETCRLSFRTPIRLVHGDALERELPADVTTAFLYNPFRGAAFRSFADRLVDTAAASRRELRVLYANPVEAELLAEVPAFRLIDVIRGWRPRADWARTTSLHVYRVDPHRTAWRRPRVD